jgi:hypothetical protein
MDFDLMPFEEGQNLVIHDLDCGQGEFIGIEPGCVFRRKLPLIPEESLPLCFPNHSG